MGLGIICLAIFLLFICSIIVSNALHHAKKIEKEKKEDSNAAIKKFFDVSRVQPRVEPKVDLPKILKKKTYRSSGYTRSSSSSYDCSMDMAMMGGGGSSCGSGGGCCSSDGSCD